MLRVRILIMIEDFVNNFCMGFFPFEIYSLSLIYSIYNIFGDLMKKFVNHSLARRSTDTRFACMLVSSLPCIARVWHACSIFTSMHFFCTLVVTVVHLCMCRAADFSAAAVLLSAFSFGNFFSPPPPQLCHLCIAGLCGAAPPCITFVRFFRSLRLHSIGIARRSRLLERLHRTSFI